MKRILIFSLAYYPSFVSGAEAAIKEITDRVSPEDIEFHMITLLFDKSAPREEKIGNIHVHRVGFGGAYLSKVLFVPLSALTARSLDKKLHFDALWSMMTYMLMPVALVRALGVRAPSILTLQDGDPYDKVFKRWFILPAVPLLNYGFRNASMVQVISKYLGTWPKKRGYSGKVELIHNGANPRDLHGSVNTKEIENLKEKLGKKEGEVWLVNTARLVHQKGADDTIRALLNLPDNVKLLLVGAGSDEKMLKDLTKELKLENRVIFTGAVDRSVVTLYRKVADVFVGPSRSEGLGNAFLSAMASRLPVVTTQEGGLAEFVYGENDLHHAQTAWVVRKDNPEDIVHAVNEIIANPEKVKIVTDTARTMVVENYDWDIVARQMREKIFRAVIK